MADLGHLAVTKAARRDEGLFETFEILAGTSRPISSPPITAMISSV